jgi:hypothetical protein
MNRWVWSWNLQQVEELARQILLGKSFLGRESSKHKDHWDRAGGGWWAGAEEGEGDEVGDALDNVHHHCPILGLSCPLTVTPTPPALPNASPMTAFKQKPWNYFGSRAEVPRLSVKVSGRVHRTHRCSQAFLESVEAYLAPWESSPTNEVDFFFFQ